MSEEGKKNIANVVSVFNRDEKEREVKARAESLGINYFDVRSIELAPDALSLVSKEEAARGVLPIAQRGEKLLLGIANPEAPEAKEIAAKLAEFFQVEPTLISWDAVKESLPLYEGLVKQVLEKPADYEIEAISSALTFEELENQINGAPIQDILKFVVTMAIQSSSSDVHIEPEKEGARVRFRIDGVLHVVGHLTADRFNYILSQIELASGLKLNVDEAQEGRLEIKLAEKSLNVRVETMPTLYGDDISLRIFNTEASLLSLDDLGLLEYDKKILTSCLARPQGMVLVVGPTGAGKTSTIYAILNGLNRPERKIITIEDPIEYAMPGITQSQINEGESFLNRLKAVLREDPDVVMVGEIRDADTADVALHAALTGHLMVSTFHANNAVTAIGLLREISSNNSLLAPAINLIIAQRLVRNLCPACKREHNLSEAESNFVERNILGLPGNIAPEELHFYEAVGCQECNEIGYKGRVGIFELLPLTVELQKLVARDDVNVSDLQEAAKKSGMVTMEQDGLIKASQGITALSEIMDAVTE